MLLKFLSPSYFLQIIQVFYLIFPASLRYYWYIMYVILRHKMWWFDTHIYCKMMTTPPSSHRITIFCEWWHLKSTLFTFNNKVLLIVVNIVTPLYVSHLMAAGLYPLPSTSFPAPPPQPPAAVTTTSLSFQEVSFLISF